MAKGIHRLCSGLMALLLLSVTIIPCYAAEGSLGGGSFGGGAGRSDFFTWTNGFGGGSFGGGAGRDEAAAAYNDYVDTLPATGYNSGGALIWTPTFDDVIEPSAGGLTLWDSSSGNCKSKLSKSCPSVSDNNGGTYTLTGDHTFEFRLNASPAKRLRLVGGNGGTKFKAPINGTYTQLLGPAGSCSALDDQGKAKTYTQETKSWDFGFLSSGSAVGDFYSYFNLDSIFLSVSASFTLPSYSIVPVELPEVGGVTAYNTTTRPTSISGGNYGVVGDNNEITKVEDNSTIVNETNNTYYNPATGLTVPITDWSYDYSDRSYDVSLESGDKATITYGDENISIVETSTASGDTVTNNYTIYYLVEGSGETPVDPPAACTHDWTETSTTPASCTVPGSKLLTCSLCSQTKTESISALGHDWEVKQTVNTQYDETGQLTQQGYTLFECGNCHEQYKSEDGALPPAVTPGTGTDLAAVDALKEKLKIAADALLGIFDKLPELFTGFTDFLAAVFPFVPTEFITIFELGLFLLIASAALRKFLS